MDIRTAVAGSDPEADLFLPDVTVSRHHARIDRTPDGFVVRDLDSVNGTYLNGRRIDEALLRPGDILQIGKYRLRVGIARPDAVGQQEGDRSTAAGDGHGAGAPSTAA